MDQLTLIQLTPEWRIALEDMASDYLANQENRYARILKMNDEDFYAYLRELETTAQGEDMPVGTIRQATFWLVQDDSTLLGSARIRPELTPDWEEGGHIDFDMRPSERGKGYGTKLLEMAVAQARSFGLKELILICDAGNPAAERVIIKNGGEPVEQAPSIKPGEPVYRYKIMTE
jgi:predicted acetyltransferase